MRERRRAVQSVVALAFASSATTGCFKATLSDARFQPAERHDIWIHQYVFGLVGSPELDARQFCGAGAVRVGVFESALTFGATLLSLGMYTPHVATVTCASGSAPRSSR